MRFFLKAHVAGYTRADGMFIAPHEDSRPNAKPDNVTPPVLSYNSGASAIGILRGYVLAGSPVGVSLSEFGEGSPTWDVVLDYAERGGQVFVDSGAFPAFTRGEAVDWQRNTRLVLALSAEAHRDGSRLHVVMPDVIGNQAASLDLLVEHRDYVNAVIDLGQDALIAIQKGPLSPHKAWRTACDILGTDDFTVSIPANKVAFSQADLNDLMAGPSKPARVHFLGVAGNKRLLAQLAATVHRASPSTLVTSDANRLRARVGVGRPITEAKKIYDVALRDAFASLLDDPAERAAWLAQSDRVLGSAANTAAIFQTEEADKRQTDLFGKALDLFSVVVAL